MKRERDFISEIISAIIYCIGMSEIFHLPNDRSLIEIDNNDDGCQES